MGADGALLIVNNSVSQAVPHVHQHVIPRTRGDTPAARVRDEVPPGGR